VLRSADVTIGFVSPTSCEVSATLAVEGAADVEHRIHAPDGTAIDLLDVVDARGADPVRIVEATQALRVSVANRAYTLRYRVRQPADRAFRCPIWLPTVATDGVSRPVRISVVLPDAMAPGASMPAFAWNGTRGTVTLGHVPAFVRVPYGSATEVRVWDTGRIMDAAAIVIFVAASAFWAWRRRGQRLVEPRSR
jgi:hypothetical protein